MDKYLNQIVSLFRNNFKIFNIFYNLCNIKHVLYNWHQATYFYNLFCTLNILMLFLVLYMHFSLFFRYNVND